MKPGYIDFVCCPRCKADLKKLKTFLFCPDCEEKYYLKKEILNTLPNFTNDLRLSADKWDKVYGQKKRLGEYNKEFEDYKNSHFEKLLKQLRETRKIKKNNVYLEIGCGPFFLGQLLAGDFKLVIGIDFSDNALEIAKKMLEEKKIKNYLLLKGDILDLPIKSQTVDLIYGGGVIEHFENTQKCINELFRVLKKGGVSFNTTPFLNLGSLSYRQIWGNIPNFPVLKQVAEFLHIKLLKGKHMRFGYEMSFLQSTLRKVHRKAGFKKVMIDKFETNLEFEYAPKILKNLFNFLAVNFRIFWPFIKVVAVK